MRNFLPAPPRAAILSLALGGFLLAPALPAEGTSAAAGVTLAAQETTLNVSGSAFVEVAPDRARIAFAVETEAEGAREAGEANARLMDQVIRALRGTGIADLRIETSGYTLSPRYAPRQGNDPQRIAGYTARNSVQVIVDDVDAVGRLVDTALEAGANRVAGMSFEVRNTEPHRQEALRLAIAAARGEASAMAEALEMRLGHPITVQGGAEFPQPRMQFRGGADMAMAMEAAPTPVEAGLQRVSANVSIQYRLHP
ncbi:SIMPL domain-containing protein [soil metagenome]